MLTDVLIKLFRVAFSLLLAAFVWFLIALAVLFIDTVCESPDVTAFVLSLIFVVFLTCRFYKLWFVVRNGKGNAAYFKIFSPKTAKGR